MHVEVPKAKKWKEFSSEYLMIVVSIVTALLLEHLVTNYHHRHLAHEATERIEAELRANQQDIDASLAHNEEMQQRLKKTTVAFLDDLKRGTADQVAIDRLMARDVKALDLSISSPSMQHEAWDVAVANQAATWIEPAKMEGYAALYGHMRDVDAISNGAGNKFVDGAQMVNVFADVQLGKAQARELLHVLNQMIVAYGAVDGNLATLRDDFAKRLAPASAHR